MTGNILVVPHHGACPYLLGLVFLGQTTLLVKL